MSVPVLLRGGLFKRQALSFVCAWSLDSEFGSFSAIS